MTGFYNRLSSAAGCRHDGLARPCPVEDVKRIGGSRETKSTL